MHSITTDNCICSSGGLISPNEKPRTVGKGLDAEHEGYDDIILIGPLDGLTVPMSEAILKPLSLEQCMTLAYL